MAHFLYLEVDGIQRFVFASPKLTIIRGGSALLDRFNRIEMKAAAEKKGGKVVVAGGGHCLVSGLSQEDAEGLGRHLGRRLRKLTDGQVTLSWAVAPEGSDWEGTWAELHQDRARRALDRPAAPPPLPPFVALCSSCGISPARGLDDMQDRHLKPLCNGCRMRLADARSVVELAEQTIWDRLRRHLGPHAHDGDVHAFRALLPDREFKELAEHGSGWKYLAYLYCDGNGMGKKLREVGSPQAYGGMSTLVDGALHKAVAAAIAKHCPPDASKENKFCAEVLLLGGDDLIVVLPADRGADFTREVLEVFHRETGGEFRLSAGLVLAPHKTPITILQRVADSLLRSAKRYAYLDEIRQRLGRSTLAEELGCSPRPPAIGYIDFQELTSAEADIERRHAVTCRPYRLDDFATLVRRTRAVHDAGVPKGRLHAIVEAVRGSEREARTVTQLVVGRARPSSDPDRDQRAALLAALQPLHTEGGQTSLQPYTIYPDAAWDLPFDLYPGTGPEAHRWSVILDALELIDHLPSDRGGA